MLHREHSAIFLTFIKLPFVIKIIVLSILTGCLTQVFLYTDFTFFQHSVAFHACLHCLPKYPFRGFQYAKDYIRKLNEDPYRNIL